MNYLITGGCGFIGINLIRHLLSGRERHKIRVIDNLSVGRREDLEEIQKSAVFAKATSSQGGQSPGDQRSEGLAHGSLLKAGDQLNAEWVELEVGDIRDGDLARKVCQGMDAIVHLAANTGVMPSIEKPVEDCTSNVLGTLNYLEAARHNGIRRFVFASSGAPLGEQNPPIHEKMVPHPISPYGASKLAGEAYCAAYHGSFSLGTVALRFANVYGPRSNHKNSVVAKFIRNILNSEPLPIYGDGNQTRDFIYVDDLIQAILLCMNEPTIGGEIFQIATHKEHSVLEVAEELNNLAGIHLGRRSDIIFENERKGEIKRNYSDISKARKMLGFEPKYDLKKGLEKTFFWFLQNQRK